MFLLDLAPEVVPFEQRFEMAHRRDRLLTRHQSDLDEREQCLGERLAALNALEALLHERRRRLCIELLTIAAVERQARAARPVTSSRTARLRQLLLHRR